METDVAIYPCKNLAIFSNTKQRSTRIGSEVIPKPIGCDFYLCTTGFAKALHGIRSEVMPFFMQTLPDLILKIKAMKSKRASFPEFLLGNWSYCGHYKKESDVWIEEEQEFVERPNQVTFTQSHLIISYSGTEKVYEYRYYSDSFECSSISDKKPFYIFGFVELITPEQPIFNLRFLHSGEIRFYELQDVYNIPKDYHTYYKLKREVL